MNKIGQWFSARSTAATEKAKKFVAYETTKKFATDTKEIAATVLSPKKAVAQARHEKFADAMKRLNVSEDDLKANYRNFAWLCWISLGFSLFLLVVTVASMAQSEIFQGAACLSITAFCLANAFKFSFRAFQIKHQKLCAVKTWYHNKGEWLPNPLT
jgi:hypothetical protein